MHLVMPSDNAMAEPNLNAVFVIIVCLAMWEVKSHTGVGGRLTR